MSEAIENPHRVSPMVERLAREAATSFHPHTEIDVVWPRYIPIALNLLTVLRKLDRPMVDAGAAVIAKQRHDQQSDEGLAMDTVWAMFDVILTERADV